MGWSVRLPSHQKLPNDQKAQKPLEEKQANWSIDETKSPTDGSPQVAAANLVNDTVLILRCKDQTTEAAFSTRYNYLGYKSVDVQLRMNDHNPIKETWKASVNGRAAFAPDAVAFIQSLPDNGKLSIKTTRSTDGKLKRPISVSVLFLRLDAKSPTPVTGIVHQWTNRQVRLIAKKGGDSIRSKRMADDPACEAQPRTCRNAITTT
jgi:hypothetical protein